MSSRRVSVVKQEEYGVEDLTGDSDDDGGRDSSAQTVSAKHGPAFIEATLMPLAQEQTINLAFPVGCPVWYNFKARGPSQHHRDHSASRLDVSHGIVKSVSLDILSRKLVYKIENKQKNDKASDDGLISLDVIIEDELAYASKCPVRVKMNAKPCSELDGEIILPRAMQNADGKLAVSYIVSFAVEGNQLRVEEGMLADRIRFRKVDVLEKSTSNQAIQRNTTNQVDAQIQTADANESDENQKALNNLKETTTNNESCEGVRCNGDQAMGTTPMFHGGAQTKTLNALNSNENQMLLDNAKEAIKNESFEDDTVFQNESASEEDAPNRGAAGDCLNRPTNECEQSNITSCEQSHPSDGVISSVTFELPDAATTLANSSYQERKIIWEPPPSSQRPAPSTDIKRHVPSNEHHASSTQSRGEGSTRSGKVCILTVPLWVTNSKEGLYLHLVGACNQKLQKVESETNCSINIPQNSGTIQIPMIITIKPNEEVGTQSSISGARKMIEDSLMEFLGNDGSKCRLLFDLAASLGGNYNILRAKSGAVRQRRHRDDAHMNKVWMHLLELHLCETHGEMSYIRKMLLDDNYLKKTGCVVKTFYGYSNMPLKLCNPYVLIWGNKLDKVDEARNIVGAILRGLQLHSKNNPRVEALGHNISGSAKSSDRKRTLYDSSAHSHSNHELSYGSNERARKSLKTGTEWKSVGCDLAESSGKICVLTVPLWMKSSKKDLHLHLAGERNNKLEMIGSETKCTIRVTHDSGDSQSPMIITITPKNRGDRTSDLLGAKLKIENSLLDFLGNDGSKARLLFELAASLRTSCNIMRSKGSAVHQRRNSHSVSNDKVWMRLLELPSCKTNGEEGQIKMLLSMTTQETDCSVETFFDQIDTPLKSCNPYVLIWGNHLGMVNSTTTLVYTALKGRQYHFQSETLEDDTQLKVLNAPSSSHENDWAL